MCLKGLCTSSNEDDEEAISRGITVSNLNSSWFKEDKDVAHKVLTEMAFYVELFLVLLKHLENELFCYIWFENVVLSVMEFWHLGEAKLIMSFIPSFQVEFLNILCKKKFYETGPI